MLRQIQAVTAISIVMGVALFHTTPTVLAENKAQFSSPLSTITEAQHLWQLLIQLESRYQQTVQSDQQIENINRLLITDCNLPNIEQLQAEVLYAEAGASRSKKGLEFRSAYTSGDIESNVGDASAYAELSWDLLRNGYLEHRHKAKQLRQQARIKEKSGQLNNQRNRARCRTYNITKQFSGLLTELLDIKHHLMKPVYAIERRAYFKGWSHLDDYLVSEEDLHQVRDELIFLLSAPDFEQNSTQLINPPLIDLDLNGILTAIRQNTQKREITMLKKSLMENRTKQLYQNRLRLFVRKEFDVSNHPNNNDAAAFGVRFRMPLEKNHQNNLHELKEQELEAYDTLNQWERINLTQQAYIEVREQIQRSTRQAYRVARSQERVRRTLLQYKMGDYVPLAVAATQVRSLFSASIEMARAKEILYQRINNLFSAAEINFNPAFIKRLPVEHNHFRGRNGQRSIYLWSDTFNNTPDQQILELLNIKGIKTALVSASSKSDKNKLDSFIEASAAVGVQVIPVLGNHRWTFKQNHAQAISIIVSEAERHGGIHLDIEPHILSGYKENRATYMADYVSLIRQVNKQLNGLQLSLAVPLHWDQTIYREIATLANRIYIMAYENPSKEHIIRRLQPLLEAIPREQIVIALRTDDFSDEWQMEQTIEYITIQTGIQNFAIHQYKTFLQQTGMPQ